MSDWLFWILLVAGLTAFGTLLKIRWRGWTAFSRGLQEAWAMRQISREQRDFRLGLGLTLWFHLIVFGWPVGWMLSGIDALPGGSIVYVTLWGGSLALSIIGVSQLFYLVPAMWIASRRKRPQVVQGLICGAAVTFLLNAACWGTFGLMALFSR